MEEIRRRKLVQLAINYQLKLVEARGVGTGGVLHCVNARYLRTYTLRSKAALVQLSQ